MVVVSSMTVGATTAAATNKISTTSKTTTSKTTINRTTINRTTTQAPDGGDGSDGGDGDDGGGDDDINDSFSDPDDLIGLDDDTALSAVRFSQRFGDRFSRRRWRLDAGRLPTVRSKPLRRSRVLRRHHGHAARRRGLRAVCRPWFQQGFEQIAPGSSRDDAACSSGTGSCTPSASSPRALLAYLMACNTPGIDFSNVDVSRAAARASSCRHSRCRRRLTASSQGRRRPAQILLARRRPGPDLALRSVCLDACHRTRV